MEAKRGQGLSLGVVVLLPKGGEGDEQIPSRAEPLCARHTGWHLDGILLNLLRHRAPLHPLYR